MAKMYVGTAPRVIGSFTDDNGDPADPGTVTVKAIYPDGTTIGTWTSPDASITNPAVGTWKFTFPSALGQVGKYWVYMAGSGGDVDAAEEAHFTLLGTRVPL